MGKCPEPEDFLFQSIISHSKLVLTRRRQQIYGQHPASVISVDRRRFFLLTHYADVEKHHKDFNTRSETAMVIL